MLRGTQIESILREAVAICVDEFRKQMAKGEKSQIILSRLTKTTEPSSPPLSRLLTVKEWAKHHNHPPEGGLRHLIFNAKSNGFERCIRRIGRRVLIDEAEYFNWVKEVNVPQK